MREIKFRALGQTDRKWHYGLLSFFQNEVAKIFENAYHTWICDADTVGQYTGLHDKNGKEIYEGDIVKNHMTDGRINSEEKDYIFEVVWCSSEASFEYRTKADILGNPCCVASNQYRVEVIGNIYENPEVLEMEGENEWYN